MTSIVTGARGFIGSSLIEALSRSGETVVATTRGVPPRYDLPGVHWRSIAHYDLRTWLELLDESVTTVYHLGWSSIPATANANPGADLADNVANGLNLLEALRHGRCRARLVFTSSGGTIYGRAPVTPTTEDVAPQPMSAYGVSKLAFETYLRIYRENWGIDAIALRVGNPFGPNQDVTRAFGAVTTFVQRAMTSRPITLFGDGGIVRDYLFIDDCVEAIMLAGQRRDLHQIINVGSGIGISLLEVIETLSRLLGRDIEWRRAPGREFDVPISVLSVDRARDLLGWQPRTSFEEGLERTIRAFTDTASTGLSHPSESVRLL
jgi:UDP-glucose 4-epimerase